jgi:hypothetical protein
MLQITLHLTRSSRLWTLLLLRLEVLLLRSEKNATLTVSMKIHKGAIFDRLKVIAIYNRVWEVTFCSAKFKFRKLSAAKCFTHKVCIMFFGLRFLI